GNDEVEVTRNLKKLIPACAGMTTHKLPETTKNNRNQKPASLRGNEMDFSLSCRCDKTDWHRLAAG
ncbi:hypothetical protein, partial [Neisseria meningitidis]|uniref:hypothetical protein n=1 Tax=Neisseria meningitidis TaxID=487 RepID=UPI001E640B75